MAKDIEYNLIPFALVTVWDIGLYSPLIYSCVCTSYLLVIYTCTFHQYLGFYHCSILV